MRALLEELQPEKLEPLQVPAEPDASPETVLECVIAMRDSFEFGPLLETLKAQSETA
jgi:hypothetical protein